MSSPAYRYTLQPYKGPGSRYTCPGCNAPHEFTRYVDTHTGELLDEQYGRCNRDVKCGYHCKPPRDGAHARPTYAFRPPAPPPPLVSIPVEVLTATQGHYERNAFAQFLRGHLGAGLADAALEKFMVGTSSYWPGACIFWLIDECGRVRGGQVVLYDEKGSTVKEPRRHTSWVHTALMKRHEQMGQPAPDWLTAYSANEVPKCPCLFGLPQLLDAPAEQPVAIVESAKTAILASYYLPNLVWLATMGCGGLSADRLAPLRGRRIILWPDVGSFDKWQQKADSLRAQGFSIAVSDVLEQGEHPLNTDLADVLLEQWPGYPPSWDEPASE